MELNRTIYGTVRNTALILGAIFVFTRPIYAQNNTGNRPDFDTSSGIEQIIDQEDFSYFEHEMRKGESLESLQDNYETHPDIMEWITNVHNIPLQQGDEIKITEAYFDHQTEDGLRRIPYPFAVEIDYENPRRQDQLYLAEDDPFYDTKNVFGYKYHDRDGNLRRELWVNKTMQDEDGRYYFYDITTRDVRFPLPGDVDDYSVSSGFGLRRNPTPASGGPDEETHHGTDWGVDIGTDVYAPVDGDLRIDYSRRNPGHNGFETDKKSGKVAILNSNIIVPVANGRGRRDRLNLTFMMYHLDDYPDDVIDEIIERQLDVRYTINEDNREEYRDWYNALFHATEDEILYDFRNRRNPLYSMHIEAEIPVYQGQKIAETGNTGRSSGPHLHLGVLSNWQLTDPEEFIDQYAMFKDVSDEDIRNRVRRYENIKDYLSE